MHRYVSSKLEPSYVVFLFQGEKLDIICIPSNRLPFENRCTWGKNGVNGRFDLLAKSHSEVWEDLHLNDYSETVNAGSVLEISNIQVWSCCCCCCFC